MGIQKTEWGEIRWLVPQVQKQEGLVMNVGVVTLDTDAHQPPHVHYEEQMVYILEGNGKTLVDQEAIWLKPGDLYHWPAGISHEIYNTGKRPLRHLLVSNPAVLEEELLFKQEGEEAFLCSEQEARELLYIAVEAVRTQFLETMPYAYAIFDTQGALVSKSRYFPTFCQQCCSPSLDFGASSCMARENLGDIQEEQVYNCPHGMETFSVPICYKNTFLGYIEGGFIRQSRDKEEKKFGVYDTPESTVAGIKTLLRKIAKAVRNYCEFDRFRKTLAEKELQITNGRESQQLLAKSLKEAEYAMTDLKINNHFLFNTLNCMASMALEGGQVPLYQSIIDLSKLFHYTLRTEETMVALERESEYLNAYLKLQKLRYGDSLELHCEVDESLYGCQVPFNFLQPIAENAFTHGFTATGKKRLGLKIGRIEDRIRIQVENNGNILDEQQCRTVNAGMKSNTVHGLSMVYRKLSAIYGEEFRLEICSNPERGTWFTIEIPVKGELKG